MTKLLGLLTGNWGKLLTGTPGEFATVNADTGNIVAALPVTDLVPFGPVVLEVIVSIGYR